MTGDGGGAAALRGGGVLVAGRLAAGLLGWAGTVVVARQLSATDWGAYSLVFSLLGLVGILVDLRVGRLVLGELLMDGGPAVIGSYLTMRAVLGVVGYALAMAVVLVGDYPAGVVAATAVAGLVLVLAAADASLDLVLSARKWWGTQALPGVVGQAVQLLLILLIAARSGGTVVSFAATVLAYSGVALVWKLVVIGRHVPVRPRVEPLRWRAWAREAAAVAVGGAIATLYFRIDSVMLSQLDTLESVGLYAVGYKFSDLAGFVAVAVCTPMLTTMVAAWPDDPAAFGRAFRHAFVLLVSASVGLVAGFVAFASPLVETLYGERYTPAAGAARLLVLGQAINYLTTLCFFALLAVGRNRRYVLAALAGLVVNVGMNLVLIPALSYEGAALATVLTELVVLAVLVPATLELQGVRPLPWRVLLVTAVSGAALLATAALASGRLAWPLAAALAVAAYLASLAAAGTWKELGQPT